MVIGASSDGTGYLQPVCEAQEVMFSNCSIRTINLRVVMIGKSLETASRFKLGSQDSPLQWFEQTKLKLLVKTPLGVDDFVRTIAGRFQTTLIG